jgi:DNA-binding response OmpR family regulator
MALILIAEDNQVTAEIIRVRLQHAGHEVLWAANGREALTQLASTRPDLILLDMMMPEVDGSEFLRIVKRDAVLGSIPVMVVSARTQEEDILEALAAGADDYLTKPMSLRELLARVDRILGQGREPLRIAVQGREGSVTVGEVVAANPGTTSVRFHRDGAQCFAIGESVKLTLSSPSLPHAIDLAATVFSRNETDPYRTYGVRIEREDDTAKEMATAFLNLVGSRGDYRVRFDESESIGIEVFTQSQGESHILLGKLQDISSSGARVVLKDGAERILCRADRFELRFQLPNVLEALTLTADIRHRSVCGDAIAYGIRFAPDGSPDFLEQQEQISEFVLGRMA